MQIRTATVLIGVLGAVAVGAPLLLVAPPVRADVAPAPTATATAWPPPSTCLTKNVGSSILVPATIESTGTGYASNDDGCLFFVRDVHFLKPSDTQTPPTRGTFSATLFPLHSLGLTEIYDSKAKCEGTSVMIYVYDANDVLAASAFLRGEWDPSASPKCVRSDNGHQLSYPAGVTATVHPLTGNREYRVLIRQTWAGEMLPITLYVGD